MKLLAKGRLSTALTVAGLAGAVTAVPVQAIRGWMIDEKIRVR